MSTLAEVEAVLDPVLVHYGFAAGQDGGRGAGDSGDVIWCAPLAELRERLPWLPEVFTLSEPNGYECLDLTVSLTLGSIVKVDLEGAALPEALRMISRTADAAEAAALLGTSAESVTPILAAVLTRLFEDPHGKNSHRAQPSP